MKKYTIMMNALTERFFDFDNKKELVKYLKYQHKKRWVVAKLVNIQWVVVVNSKQPKQWKMIGLVDDGCPLGKWFRVYDDQKNQFIKL